MIKKNEIMDKHGILSRINSPDDVKKLNNNEIPELSKELRSALIKTVLENGGHLASNLGVVELTVALSRVFDFPRDKVVFDVGHQSYVYKMLTGRYKNFDSLRNDGGISGFPSRSESEYDFFGTGHAGTSISAALGFAEAERMMRINEVNAAVVFDPDFEQSHSVQIAADVSNCMMGSAASLYIRAVIEAELSGESDDLISYRMLYNPRLISAYSFQPGIIALVIIITVLIFTSVALVREKESGTIDFVTLSPVSLNIFYFGKSIPYAVLGLLVGAIALGMGVLTTGIPVRGSYLAIFLVTALYTFTTMRLGVYVALVTSGQANAFAICWGVIIMPVIYFGSVIVPADNLPEWGQVISGFIYVRWYVDALRKLLIQGVDAIYVAKELMLMSISTIVISLACHFKLKRLSR